jgi:hypothetical protein
MKDSLKKRTKRGQSMKETVKLILKNLKTIPQQKKEKRLQLGLMKHGVTEKHQINEMQIYLRLVITRNP